VRRYADAEKAAALAVSATGRIDILIPFAGGYEPRMCQSPVPFFEQPVEVLDWGIDVNLKGAIYFARACMPVMVKGGQGGVICCIGSTSGFEGDAKGAISLKEKSPAPWARAYKEGGQSFMEWEYSKDKNGKEITDPSQLSISFAKATGIFTGKAKVYFDYEVFNNKNGEEIWTKQHKDAALPYSGVMIYDGEGGYNGYGSAVHTFKYTDYDENDKKTTVTKKVTLPVSLAPADGE
jgi:NAD(P)-dependent dehydrogenase (short-subunit alcohol dehydrogenase family)